MPVNMTKVQLDFWRELLAPFRDDELSQVPARGGKKTLTYLDKRALENRLDSVCGPHGWYPQYEATNRGYKCRLSILVPTSEHGATTNWTWIAKEDGAGFEEMGSYNKTTNEWEADVDNDEKSGYTNALRRAAQDAWGIGRYLYNKGIPSFLDPNATASDVRPANRPSTEPNREIAQRPRDTTAINESPVKPAAHAAAPAAPKYDADYFRLPKPGMAYRWCKAMEGVFETQLVRGMTDEAARLGFSTQFNDWNEAQTVAVCMSAIRHISSQRSYAGQFADLLAKDAGPAPTPKPASQGVNIADFRKEIVTKLQALILRQTGREAATDQMKSMFLEIAPQCKTQGGNAGEVPDSLAGTTDPVWLKNIVAFIDDQIAGVNTATPVSAEVADVPF